MAPNIGELADHQTDPRDPTPRPVGWVRLAPLLIVALGLALYLPGLTWGLPSAASWSQDTIAGVRTTETVARWPMKWVGRYPPLHYLILHAAYLPSLHAAVDAGDAHVDPETGAYRFNPPYAPKFGRLILIARVISVAMAIGAALGVWAATRVWTGDELAALLAAVVLMICATFCYFAHLGNVDVPALCWLAWSVYFYARALRGGGWLDAALLGLFASLAISTKDAVGGIYPGMAIVLLVTEAARCRPGRTWWRALLRALLRPKWPIGLALFLVPYLLVFGTHANPDSLGQHLRYWMGVTPGTTHAGQFRYPDQLSLFGASIWYAAGAVGWPMLVAIAASTVYALRRHARLALAVLVPAVGFYLVVIAQIHFVYSRFLLPVLALVAVLVGVATADLLRSRSIPAILRVGAPCLIAMLTAAYALAVNCEMLTDSRYDVEQWFDANVERPSSVGVFSKSQYLPRVAEQRYSVYRLEMNRATFDRPAPDFLILTSYNYEDFDEDQAACMRELMRGHLGYRPAAMFDGRFLGTGSSALSLAGWGALPPGKISPTVHVLRKTDRVDTSNPLPR